MKRIKLFAAQFGFRSYDDLFILNYATPELLSDFTKLEKNRLFIELNKQENYIVVNIN